MQAEGTRVERRKDNAPERLEWHGLFFHEKKDSSEKHAMFTRAIPERFNLGKSKGQGDCFFDSCAEALNEQVGREEYTVKSLRLLCHEYAVALDKQCGNNPNHPDNWIAKTFNNPAKYQEYLANIRYTVEEREAGEGVGDDRLTIWGEQHIDGRIICERLGGKLHVIEVRENPDDETTKDQKFMASHNLVDQSGLKNLDGEVIDWHDGKTIHIGACNLHFVPILKKTTIQKGHVDSFEIQKSPVKENVVVKPPSKKALKVEDTLIQAKFSSVPKTKDARLILIVDMNYKKQWQYCGKKLKAFFDLVNRHKANVRQLDIVLTCYLYRYDKWQESASGLAEEWININAAELSDAREKFESNIALNVIDWFSLFKQSIFQESLQCVTELYDKNDEFKARVDVASKPLMKRTGIRDNAKVFLLEKSAFFRMARGIVCANLSSLSAVDEFVRKNCNEEGALSFCGYTLSETQYPKMVSSDLQAKALNTSDDVIEKCADAVASCGDMRTLIFYISHVMECEAQGHFKRSTQVAFFKHRMIAIQDSLKKINEHNSEKSSQCGSEPGSPRSSF